MEGCSCYSSPTSRIAYFRFPVIRHLHATKHLSMNCYSACSTTTYYTILLIFYPFQAISHVSPPCSSFFVLFCFSLEMFEGSGFRVGWSYVRSSTRLQLENPFLAIFIVPHANSSKLPPSVPSPNLFSPADVSGPFCAYVSLPSCACSVDELLKIQYGGRFGGIDRMDLEKNV